MFAVDGNYKGLLLEIAMRDFGIRRPVYSHYEYGPAHAKVFFCKCQFLDESTSSDGRTKVEAEQAASCEMLEIIRARSFSEKVKAVKDEKAGSSAIVAELAGAVEGLVTDSRFDVLSLYGDAVLRYYIIRDLFDRFPQFQEGMLTRIVSEALKEKVRAKIAINLGLIPYVRTLPTSGVLAETLSAVIGKLALLDDELCKSIVMKFYRRFINDAITIILEKPDFDADIDMSSHLKTTIHNFKSELQEYSQKRGSPLPIYLVIDKGGAAHDLTFTVSCSFEGYLAIGSANNIKSAEQQAAGEILTILRKADAASARIVKYSKTAVAGFSEVKRFKAPDLHELKMTIHWTHFESLKYLHHAFTHPSKSLDCNYQRLEILGDALLKKCIVAYILRKYPDYQDKAFVSTKIDYLVSEAMQATIAMRFNLKKFIFTAADHTPSILGDVLEALIAVIYLDAEARKSTTPIGKRVQNPDAVIVSWFLGDIEAVFGRSRTKTVPFFDSKLTKKSTAYLSAIKPR